MYLHATKTCPKLPAILWLLCSIGTSASAQLVAKFSRDKLLGCSPLVVHFTNQTTGASANATYLWDFGNGNTSTEISPSAVYVDPVGYTVTLTVRDGASQSSESLGISVDPPPTGVDFSASAVKGCLPMTVTFTATANTGLYQGSKFVWDFGDGSTYTGFGLDPTGNSSSISHTYQSVEQVPVSLTLVNGIGCETSVKKPALITVLPALTAGFTSDKQVLCLASDPVQFTNNSTGPGTLDYLWDFGDGHTSTQPDPQYAFNVAGIYTVKLTAHSSEGCTATSTQATPLNVASYHTDFDVPSLICMNNYAVFNNKSTPLPTYSTWQVDGLTISNYSSNLGYTFNAAGTHTVNLQNAFGTCPQSLSKQVIVKDLPNVGPFTATIQGKCGAPVTVAFNDATPGATSWDWDFTYYGYSSGNRSALQSPSFTYPTNGYYTVYLKVTNADGCSSATSGTVQINPPVVGIYTNGNTSSCGTPITATFNTSTTETLTIYEWNFGDGTIGSTDPSPTHTFSAPGTYDVQLSYTTQNGCKGTSNYIHFVLAAPIKVDFSALNTTICGNSAASFVAAPPDPNVIWWTWDFGDGLPTYPTTYNANHVYSAPGTYTVKLYATGVCDTVITKTNYITVLPPFPKISGFTNTCDSSRGRVNFTQGSFQANSVTWNFGDGTTLTTPGDQTTISHVYTKTGRYTVYLTATNGQCSVTDMVQVPVLIKQSPLLTASDTAVCTNGQLLVKIANLEPNPNPFAYGDHYYIQKAEYKDGSAFLGSLINQNPTYIFVPPFSGTMSNFAAGETGFRMILIEANFGCADTTNFVPVSVKGGISAFTANPPACFQSPVAFIDRSQSTTNNPILKWQWNFGDGQSITNDHAGNVSHTYTGPGSYYVSLTTTDAGGCISQSPSYEYVNVPGPQASFSPSGTNVPLNTTIYFYNTSNTFGSSPTTWLWDFGDGQTSTDFSPSHTYPVAGQYIVTLTAAGPPGACVTTFTQTIIVRNFNTAFRFTKSFTSGACPPALVSFTNTSVGYSYVSWYFGDGDTVGNLNFPSHVYVKPGNYIVTLNVYAPNGIRGQYIDSILIPIPSATLAAVPVTACPGDTVTLTAKSANTVNYLWDYGDGGVVSSGDTTGKHLYGEPGKYQPSVVVQDANGCSVAVKLPDPVIIRPKPTIQFSPAQPLVCRGSSMTIQSGNGGSVYNWSPPTGLDNPGSAAPIASPLTTTTYTLSVADDIGCRNSDTVTVAVVQPGKVSVSADASICAGTSVTLRASGESSYQWIDVTDGLSDVRSPDPRAQPDTSTLYTVTGSDAHGCFTDTARVRVTILPLPTVNAGPDLVLLAGETTDLHASGSNDIASLNWSPAQYLSCYDCATPHCDPLASITYIVTAKGQDGCMASDTVAVKVDCEEKRVAIPNAFTPNGDGNNDVFIVKGISVIKHIAIYSRWGERVYERSNILAGDRSSCWNGTFQGQNCPTGVYVYEIEMTCPTGGEFKRGGTVVLVR